MSPSTLRSAVVATLVMFAPALASAQGAPSNPPPAAAANPIDPAAQERSGRQALAACRGDMATLCGNVEKGGGRKLQCLKDNQAKLSAGCQAAIQGVLAKNTGDAGKAGKLKQACSADTATFCAGVEKGGGRIAKCLKDNAAKLSPSCQAAFQERQGMQLLKKNAKHACAADKQALCGSAEKGRAAVQCLREKQAQASPGCQQALASLPAPRVKALQ